MAPARDVSSDISVYKMRATITTFFLLLGHQVLEQRTKKVACIHIEMCVLINGLVGSSFL